MPDILEDNGWTLPAVIGPARKLKPFQHTTDHHIIEQDYVQNFDNWTPLALNTPYPTDPNFVLVQEKDPEDHGGGVVKWTRVYAKVPTTWSEAGGTYSYSFIGFLGVWGLNVTNITGRNRFVETVPVKITRDYYLTGVGGTFATSLDITPINEQKYYLGDVKIVVDFLWDNPPFTNSPTPTRAAYEALVLAGSYIAVESSVVSRWMGNIFVRETKYIKAK